MKNPLEDYIRSHREAFDDQHPPDHLWEQVLAELEGPEKRKASGTPVHRFKSMNASLRSMLRIAATVMIAGVLGIIVYFYGKQQGYEDYARINPELAAANSSMQELISQKKDSIASFVSNNPELGTEFTRALAYMESNYDSLKNQLAHSPNRERTLEAMIINLQTQADVLNQQLFILHQVTYRKNEKL